MVLALEVRSKPLVTVRSKKTTVMFFDHKNLPCKKFSSNDSLPNYELIVHDDWYHCFTFLLTASIKMLDSAPADQSEECSRRLLDNCRLSEVEKFNMLRGISATVASIRATLPARSSKEEHERVMLSLYHERVAIDLNIHRNTLEVDIEVYRKPLVVERQHHSLEFFLRRTSW